MLFALAALTLAVPSTAQAQNATGAPGITGTAQVGETLTATQGTIADSDGITPGSWFSNATTTVQWIRVDGGSDSDISSATDRTYTLVTADEGKQVKVKVDFTDDDRNDESRTSDAYPADSTVLPAPPPLVSNISAASSTALRLGTDTDSKDAVQLFTTGTNAGGYTLTSIEFSFYSTRTSTNTFVPTVKLHNVTVSGSSVTLGTAVATLTTSSTFVSNPTAAHETYTAPPDTTLAPSTTYGVFAEGGPTGTRWAQLDTGDEDATPAAGWSIGDQIATRAHDATAGFTVGSTGSGQIRVNGTAKAGPAEVPSDWSLKPTGLAAGTQFRLLFLSSTRRNASSTDIATYNTFIQGRAAAGHTDIRAYSAGFRVVGCTAAVDARDNTKTTYTTTDKGVPRLLAQRRQGRRPVRGFLRRVLGRRGQRQERVRHQRARYQPKRQLAPHRLRPRRHRGSRARRVPGERRPAQLLR